MTSRVATLLFVLGCTRSAPNQVEASVLPEVSASAAAASATVVVAPASRCLPLVINHTCVMPCTAATRDDAGAYRVDIWNQKEVRVETSCDDGGCIDVLAVDMPMGGACAARPLDRACHFSSGTCLGSISDPNWPPRASASASASTKTPAPATISTAYDYGRHHICIPDTWTDGVTILPGPPRCGAIPGKHIWDGDVHRPCGPCAFNFDPAVTASERAKNANACCFRGSSPSGP